MVCCLVKHYLSRFQLPKGTGRDVTFRMMTLGDDELVLDKSEYMIDSAGGSTTRYTCDESGIAVEVEGSRITIHGTVVVLIVFLWDKIPKHSPDLMEGELFVSSRRTLCDRC